MDQPKPEEPDWVRDQWDRKITIEHFRVRLKQVVTIHHAMFEKLLFEGQILPFELGGLLEDAGKTYLRFSQEIEQYHGRPDSMLNSSLKPES
jgi:hypothetical protein